MGRWVSRWRKCPTCKGTGKIKPEPEEGQDPEDVQEVRCPDCKGRKQILSPPMH